jgi:hypothetical protein
MAGPSLQTSIFGKIARLVPGFNQEGADAIPRLGRYGEAYTFPLLRKQHALADEGSYRVTSNTVGIAIGTPIIFTAINPTLIIFNNDAPTNPAAKRIYLDYINLCTTVAGTVTATATLTQAAVYVDNGNRYTSGGTNLTANIISPNMDVPMPTVASIYFGALVATAATAAQRTVSGLRTIRPLAAATTTPDVVGEIKQLNFGSVEGSMNGSVVAASPNYIPIAFPPVIIGPQQCALIYIWNVSGANGTPPQFVPEIGHWER